MSSLTTAPAAVAAIAREANSIEVRHHLWIKLCAVAAILLTVVLAIYGFDYYTLDKAHRVLSPKHHLLRPSGAVGIRLGLFGVVLFLLLYLYSIRKSSKWLSRQGNSRHWLNFHVLLGVLAPVVITFHASFKFGGLAGVAYWIMVAVAVSGFVGRYVYSLIPRTLGAAEVSVKELRDESQKLAQKLNQQEVLSHEDFAPLLKFPPQSEVAAMSVMGALWLAICNDAERPFKIAELRRKALLSFGGLAAFRGLVRSHHPQIENALDLLRDEAALNKKMLMLSKSQELFQLWHVIHRPFSYSFAILALIHIGVALLMGYF
jgi:hypothetical protein